MANEKRLIDANAALEELCKYCSCGCYEECGERCVEFRNISKLPTVDAVEVVRCKDCKHYNQTMNECESLHFWFSEDGGLNVKEDDFCSYGERREGE